MPAGDAFLAEKSVSRYLFVRVLVVVEWITFGFFLFLGRSSSSLSPRAAVVVVVGQNQVVLVVVVDDQHVLLHNSKCIKAEKNH